MTTEKTTCTYIIREPFPTALKRLRRSFQDAKLKIGGELDFAGRFRKALGLDLPACTVLLVLPVAWTREELSADPSAAAITPFHVVVSARGSQTEVHVLDALPRCDGPGERPALRKLAQMEHSICRLIETIGTRNLDL